MRNEVAGVAAGPGDRDSAAQGADQQPQPEDIGAAEPRHEDANVPPEVRKILC